MSQALRVVDIFWLTIFLGLSSAASTTCDSDDAGCRDEFSLIQKSTREIAAVSMEANTHAMIGEFKSKVGTAEGRGDFLQVGENMLRMLNATDHLSEHNQTLLGQVKTLINDVLIVNMDAEHASNNVELVVAAQAVHTCNDNAEQSDTGAVATRRNRTSDAREGHIQCREQELAHYNQRVANTTALFNHITAIAPVHVVSWQGVWKTTRDLAAIDNYFEENQDFVEWFATASSSFNSVVFYSNEANSTHSEKQEDCDEKQKLFEEEYVLYLFVVNDTCGAHGRCYTEAKNTYDEHLAAFKVVEVHHQQSYEAGIIIISKIECLLVEGTHSDCSEPFINESRYNLTEHVLPSPTECNLGSLHEICSDDFENAEYALLNDHTPPANCITCHNSAAPDLDMVGGCSFFSTPDGQEYCHHGQNFLKHLSSEACCACGGGTRFTL